MADSGEMHVSLEDLLNLQADLNLLSQNLEELNDLAQTDLSAVGQYWQDGKFEEFSNVYMPQINKIGEIATYYKQWASGPLQETIDKEKKYQGWGPGGGSGIGTGSGGSASSDTTQAPKPNKFLEAQRRMNNPSEAERPHSPQPQPWPYNQENHYDPSKLERPRSPQYQQWPYNPPKNSTSGDSSSSKPIKPVPPKPSDSGFDTPQNVREPLSPKEIAMLEKLYGRGR